MRRPFIRILGSRVDQVSFSAALECIESFLKSSSSHHVVTANTLMCLSAEQDLELRAIIDRASLVVPESWGIGWASRRLGHTLPRFTPGIDLLNALCQWAVEDRRSVYLLGAKPGVAEQAAAALKYRFEGLKIAGTHHGYFRAAEETDILAAIRQASPTFLFVGMTVPGQEKWIARHLKELQVPVVMGVGGSFDVLSGRLRRAPSWMRKAGMEWMYRLIQEPWRWRRIAQLPIFAWKIMRQSGMANGK